MRARLLASLILLAAVPAAAAMAADLRYKAPPLQPLPFSWTGFYAGVNAGYASGDPTATITPANVPPPNTGPFGEVESGNGAAADSIK